MTISDDSMNSNPTPLFKKKFNFELAILKMNAMYRLPIAPKPSTLEEIKWQQAKFSTEMLPLNELDALRKRIHDFFGITLKDEIQEHESILNGIGNTYADDTEMLVELADLLGDIQVYCASEMARFGIPNQEVLEIIMASNESKLDEKGQPIYNEQGKFMKGPNYWKPESKIRELILQLRGEVDDSASAT